MNKDIKIKKEREARVGSQERGRAECTEERGRGKHGGQMGVGQLAKANSRKAH